MSDTPIVTGGVDRVKVHDKGTDKQRYGIQIGGEWFNRFGDTPEGLEEGSLVELEYEETEYGNKITDISVVEESGGSGSVENPSGSVDNSNKGAAGSETTSNLTFKDRSILTQVAFKSAIRQLDYNSADDIAEHFDQVKSLANGYRNILTELVTEGGNK